MKNGIISSTCNALANNKGIEQFEHFSFETKIFLRKVGKKLRNEIIKIIANKDFAVLSNDYIKRVISDLNPSLGKDIKKIRQKLIDQILLTSINTVIGSLIDKEENERRLIIRKSLEETYSGGFEFFYNFIKNVGSLDLFEIIANYKGIQKGEFNAEELYLPLKMEYEFFSEAVKFIQEKNEAEFEQFIIFVSGKQKIENRTINENDELNLNGAGIPELFPKISKYTDQAIKYGNFHSLTRLFRIISSEIFGENYEAFYTNGTKLSFLALQNRFWQKYPNAHIVSTPLEYLPMYYIAPKERRHKVNILGFCIKNKEIKINEEELIMSMIKKGEQIGSSPIVLLISSEFRIGALKIDINKINSIVENENNRLGQKKYHLWIDSSQDSRIFNGPDIVFYSKRHGGTNGGMTIVNNNTYPRDNIDIKEALILRSGFATEYIARNIASLFAQNNKFGHELIDLTKLPNLWKYKGKGTYIIEQIKKADVYLKSSRINELFRLDYYIPNPNEKGWQVNSILRFIPTAKGEEVLNQMGLSPNDLTKLFHEKKIQISNFSLKDIPGFTPRDTINKSHVIKSLKSLIELADDDNCDLQSFIDEVEKFEDHYKDKIVISLLPTSKLDKKGVVEYFKLTLEQHEYFRLFVHVVQKPGTLEEFIKRVEKIFIDKL